MPASDLPMLVVNNRRTGSARAKRGKTRDSQSSLPSHVVAMIVVVKFLSYYRISTARTQESSQCVARGSSRPVLKEGLTPAISARLPRCQAANPAKLRSSCSPELLRAVLQAVRVMSASLLRFVVCGSEVRPQAPQTRCQLSSFRSTSFYLEFLFGVRYSGPPSGSLACGPCLRKSATGVNVHGTAGLSENVRGGTKGSF